MELSGSVALVSDIIAPLRVADDPMQQAGSEHFVAAKLRRDVLKHGIAVGLRRGFGSLHQPVEIVSGQPQSQLIERSDGKAPPKPRECGITTLVQQRVKIYFYPVREAGRYH